MTNGIVLYSNITHISFRLINWTIWLLLNYTHWLMITVLHWSVIRDKVILPSAFTEITLKHLTCTFIKLLDRRRANVQVKVKSRLWFWTVPSPFYLVCQKIHLSTSSETLCTDVTSRTHHCDFYFIINWLSLHIRQDFYWLAFIYWTLLWSEISLKDGARTQTQRSMGFY